MNFLTLHNFFNPVVHISCWSYCWHCHHYLFLQTSWYCSFFVRHFQQLKLFVFVVFPSCFADCCISCHSMYVLFLLLLHLPLLIIAGRLFVFVNSLTSLFVYFCLNLNGPFLVFLCSYLPLVEFWISFHGFYWNFAGPTPLMWMK